MNRRFIDILFFLICFFIIFNNTPLNMQAKFLGGPIGNKLVFYPVFIGLLYTLYCRLRYGNVFVKQDMINKYLLLYLLVTLISLFIGLYNYPYYDLIITGPVDQIPKLTKVLGLLSSMGIDIERQVLTIVWVIFRAVKGLFIEIIFTFITAYMIYCWYYNSSDRALKIFLIGMITSLGVIFLYSIVELFYLSGYEAATNILTYINPFIHSIKENGKWWPPLLWNGQLRAIFAEPSYFGLYSAFSIPFLWYLVLKNEFVRKSTYIYITITCIMTFLLMLTKSRTGFLLHIGQLCLLIFLVSYLQNKQYLKMTCVIVLCSLFAFIIGNYYVSNVMNLNSNVKSGVSLHTSIIEYIDSNAVSLANPDKRSNRARYSIMEADFKIGLDNPFFGVGYSLRTAYVPDYLSKKALENKEIQMWLHFQNKLGVLRTGIPLLGEYTGRFAERGVIGMIVFYFPAIYLVHRFISYRNTYKRKNELSVFMWFISFIGVMVSVISCHINTTFYYWLLLGIGYIFIFVTEKEKVGNE